MPADPSDREPLELLAEEFQARFRSGERPSLTEYVERHPELATEIRELFPALVMMEAAGLREPRATGALRGHATADGSRLEQLGDYCIIREIGRGGMGIVYEAEHQSLGRRVALKVLPFRHSVNSNSLARFRREARAAARLHHTNIVPVFDVGERDGLHYYAMQYIEGQGLHEVLAEVRRLRGNPNDRGSSPSNRSAGASDGRRLEESLAQGLLTGDYGATLADPGFTPADGDASEPVAAETTVDDSENQDAVDSSANHGSATNTSNSEPCRVRNDSSGLGSGTTRRYYHSIAQIGRQVADALAYAHKQGIIHRDIKPSNLLLDPHGTVWVTDFGLAKDDGADLTQTGDIVGTLRYLAPERFRGDSDARSDVYSLGATLYELLTLEPAFADSDRARLLRRVAHDEPQAPSRVDPRVPRDLETIVLKAMSKESKLRYQTADQLSDDLQRFLSDRPIHARRVTITERALLWSRRNPFLAALLGIVAALLLVVGTGAAFGFLLRRERDDALAAHQEAQEASETIAALQREAEIRALLADATKLRLSGKPGRRDKVLEKIRGAVALQPGSDFRDVARDEAIAALALTDLRFGAIGNPLQRFENTIVQKFENTIAQSGGLTISPDEQWLAVHFDSPEPGHLQVWDISTERPVFPEPIGYHQGLDFSHDSRRLAVAGWDNMIHVWDLSTGTESSRIALPDKPTDVAFDPLDRRLAVCFRNANFPILIFDILTQRLLTEIPSRGAAESVSWHPDGQRLAVGLGSLDRCEVWDVARRRCLVRFEGHQKPVDTSARFDSSGRYLVSLSEYSAMKCWDAGTGRLLLTLGSGTYWGGSNLKSGNHTVPDRGSTLVGTTQQEFTLVPSTIFSSLTSRIGQRQRVIDVAPVDQTHHLLAVAMQDGFSIWDLSTQHELAHVTAGTIFNLRFDWEKRVLITVGPNGIGHWPLGLMEAGSIQLGPAEIAPILPTPTAGSISANAPCVAVLRPGNARILSLTGVELTSFTPPAKDEYIRLSPDGRLVATHSWHNSRTNVWDAQTGALRQELLTSSTDSVEFSPDSTTLITSRDIRYDVWDVATGVARQRIERDDSDFPCSGDMSRDGRVLAIERSPGIVGLVEASTGRIVCTLESPHKVRLRKVHFSDDGSTLLAVADGAVQVWDLRRLRRDLAALELDWDGPAIPESASGLEAPPMQIVESAIQTDSETIQLRALRAATTAYDRAVASGQPLFAAANELAWALIMSPQRDSDWTRAIALAEQAVAGNPSQPVFRETCGAALCRAGRLWEALQMLDSAKIDTDDHATRARGLFWRAMVCGRLNDWPRARELFQLGYSSQRMHELLQDELDPDLPALHQEVQRLFEGDYRELLSACNSPCTAMDYCIWGDRAFVKGRWQQAINNFTEALDKDDRIARAYSIRGQCYARIGQRAKAAKDFNEAFDLQFNDEQIGQWWANVTLYLGDAEGYAAVCAKMRDRFANSLDRRKVHCLSWALFLGPQDTPDKEALMPLKRWMVPDRREDDFDYVECTALAGGYLRTGEYEAALRCLDRSDKLAGDWFSRPLNDLLRAITLVRLGRVSEARPFVEKGRRFCDQNLKSTPEAPFGELSDKAWWDWYSFQILRRELEELMREADAVTSPP